MGEISGLQSGSGGAADRFCLALFIGIHGRTAAPGCQTAHPFVSVMLMADAKGRRAFNERGGLPRIPLTAGNKLAPRVAIASIVAPNYVGGLAAYMRGLAVHLSDQASVKGFFVCIHERHSTLADAQESLPWPVHAVQPRLSWDHAQRFLSRLASRPALHLLFEGVLRVVVPPTAIERLCGSIDVIHFVGTGWDLFGFPLSFAAHRRGMRFTVCPAVHPRSWGGDRIDVRLYRRADSVFCLSDYEKTYLRDLGVDDKRLVRCGLPSMCRMDGDGTRFRREHGLGTRRVVLFAGRRDEGKGYPAVLRAWGQVSQQLPDAVLVLAGPGGQEFNDLVAELSPDSVRDLGTPGELMKADALAGCDLFCLPSAHESFGIVYVEAWSYGKPVICGTAPACRELVEDGVTGLWADQNPQTIADKLISLLINRENIRRMGEAGRTLQESRYTVEAMLQAHLQAWELV